MTTQLANLLNQCINCLQSDDDTSAEQSLNQAIQLDPTNTDVLHFFGIIESKRRKFDSALVYFQKALKTAPHSVFINNNIGKALIELKRYNEALIFFDRAIAIDPNNFEAYCNKGHTLQSLQRYEDALIAYDKAIFIDPHNTEAYCKMGSVLQDLNRFEEAIAQFDQALRLKPDYCEAYNSKGAAHFELLQYDEALIACDKAIAINTHYPQIYLNKSVTLQALKQYSEALKNLHKAIEIDADCADAHFNAGILYLKLGQFQSGWVGWEWRWSTSNFDSLRYVTAKPVWSGEKTEQRVLVWPEQGIGDQILYSSMFKELGLLSSKVIVSIEARLLSICRRSFPNLDFVDSRIPISDVAYDLQISMGSLMKHLRLNEDSFRNPSFPYLTDDKQRTASIRDYLDSMKSNKLVCGLSWRTLNMPVGKHRSIPLDKLTPLLNLDQYGFINLQHGMIAPDLKLLQDQVAKKIHQFPDIDLFNDLEGILSLIQACDLIVTCDNSVVHMAGALNKKTILIAPFETGKFWYWHEVGGSSLCYPSVKVFSQHRQGSWDEVIEQVKLYLEDSVSK